MKRLLTTAALCVVASTFAFGGIADAQSYHHGRGHSGHSGHFDRGHNGWHDRSDWRRGGFVARNDWDHGYAVDYHRYHLRRPPYGYEWRRVGNNYVLAAVASGLIADIILNGH